MLILLGAALFAFGLLLFSLGVAVWLIGLAIRIAVLLVQVVLLITMAGIAVYSWLHQRAKVTVLEGEILPPEPTHTPKRGSLPALPFDPTPI